MIPIEIEKIKNQLYAHAEEEAEELADRVYQKRMSEADQTYGRLKEDIEYFQSREFLRELVNCRLKGKEAFSLSDGHRFSGMLWRLGNIYSDPQVVRCIYGKSISKLVSARVDARMSALYIPLDQFSKKSLFKFCEFMETAHPSIRSCLNNCNDWDSSDRWRTRTVDTFKHIIPFSLLSKKEIKVMQDAWVSQIKESKVTAGMRNIGWVTFLRKYPSETSYKTFFEYVEKYNINKTRVGVIARRCPDFFMSLSAEELKKYGIKGKNLVTIFYDFHQFAGFKHVVPSDFHLEMMEHQLVLDLMRGKPTSISVREKLDFVKELV